MDITNNINILEECICSLNKSLREEALKSLIKDILNKYIKEENLLCLVCSEEKELIKLECCSSKICKDCKEKMGKCPFCRAIWNEQRNAEEERRLINNYNLNNFPLSDDDVIDSQNNFIDDTKKIIEFFYNKIMYLSREGFISYPNASKYPLFKHPITNKFYKGSNVQNPILDYIIRLSLDDSYIQESFNNNNIYKIHTPLRRNCYYSLKFTNNLDDFANSSNILFIISLLGEVHNIRLCNTFLTYLGLNGFL